jgi:uncharacterized protein
MNNDRSASSRSLPSRPNLEHLRNEAKQRLKAMRSEQPAASLSEAQLLVARTNGFPSWRKLKAYVDALHDSGQPLINAVCTGDLKTISAILDRHPELVNANTDIDQRALMPVDYSGVPSKPREALTLPLLHLAIVENKVDALRLLIARGANVNARNADGRLPLHDCFELNHDDFARILLDAGAVADVCAAAAYGMHDRLRQILERTPEQANDLQTGNSPLGWAAYGHQPVSAEILIEHGAVVDRPPYDGCTWVPAAMANSKDVARVLLQHGANPNWQDKEGDTPLHCVIRSRIVVDPSAFVRVMLEFGADVTLRNQAGRTALEEAVLQAGTNAESYSPIRPIARKKLEESTELLSGAARKLK